MNLKRKTASHSGSSNRIHFSEENAAQMLMQKIRAELPSAGKRSLVIVCIGTDRSTGDALGPIVGSKLQQKGSSDFHVYGTLDKPVHAVNLEERLEHIYAQHPNPYMIGVDASLGKINNVGMITFGQGPVKPGAGVKKQLPPVGDAHITGIVNVSGFMEYFVLQNTRLNLVMQMADTISDSLNFGCTKENRSTFPFRVSYQ